LGELPNRLLLFLLTSNWGGEQELVARYLWPKGEVEIPATQVASVALIQKGTGWKASDVLVIRTKTGRDYVSTAPVPDTEVLPDKIREAIGFRKKTTNN